MVSWKGIKIADAGFLINLDERTDRLLQSQEELIKNEITGVERFPAIKITKDDENGWRIRGCTHSHIDILKKQIENNWDRVIIFEDDFYFEVCTTRDYKFNENNIKFISESKFDCLFLGARLKEPTTFENENFLIPKSFNQTHSYITSLKFAKFVIENFNYLDKSSVVYGEQIDTFYSVLCTRDHWKMDNYFKDTEIIRNHDLKIFAHHPILFNQRPSFSNITNKYESFDKFNSFLNLKYYPKPEIYGTP